MALQVQFADAWLEYMWGAASATVTPVAYDYKLVIVDPSHTWDSTADAFLSDIDVADRLATSDALANVTFTDGVMDADDVPFTAVTCTAATYAVIIYDSETAATTRIVGMAEFSAPLTSAGGDINVRFAATGVASIAEVAA